MVERVAHGLPALMDVEERFDLQHGADPAVTRTLVTALEQPAIDLLAFEFTGFDDLVEARLWVVEQVAQQPQVQRMHLGDIALVRQVVGAGAVTLVEPFEALVAEAYRGF